MSCDPGGQKDLKKLVDKLKEYGKQMHQTGDEELAYQRKVRGENNKTLAKILDTQMPIMEGDRDFGQEAIQRYHDIYQPIEDKMVNELTNYDTPEKREQASSEAISDTRRALDATRQQAEQQLSGMGVDPSQIRAGALTRIIDVGASSQEAQASYQARKGVEQQGIQYLGQAVNMGRDTQNRALQFNNQALQAGSTAMSGALNTAVTNANIVGTPTQYYGLSTQSLSAGASGSTQVKDPWMELINTGGQIAGTAAGGYASSGGGSAGGGGGGAGA